MCIERNMLFSVYQVTHRAAGTALHPECARVA
jgi:hypothetical protein